LIEARNHAEQLVYTAEKSLKDAGDKIGDDIKRSVQEAIDALKTVNNSDDAEAIAAKTEVLSTELQKIGSAMYNQGDASSQPNAADDTPNEGEPTTNESN